MPTNKNGYMNGYYRKERNRIVAELGGMCVSCGGTDKLEIHHKKPILKGGNRGREARLTEWKRNMDNLELLCHECHKDWHNKNGVEYNGK